MLSYLAVTSQPPLILTLLTNLTQVAIFLRLPIAIKSLLLGAMGTVYILLIELR